MGGVEILPRIFMKNTFRTPVFKIFALAILVAILCLTVVACDPKPTPSDNDLPDYPEGATALTKENFEQYFDVKVHTDCTFDFSTSGDDLVFPKATTYVAFVAKNGFLDVACEVKYTVNTKVFQSSYAAMKYSVEMEEQTLILHETDYQNKAYTLISGQPSYYEFKVESGTDNITINSVKGYVILGENYTPTDYEKLLESDYANSESIKDALEGEINDLAMGIAMGTTKTYGMSAKSGFTFKSVYGSDRNMSTSAHSTIKADLENYRYAHDGEVYYYNREDGKIYHQYYNKFGLIIEEVLPWEVSDMLNEMIPPLDGLLDENAVYVNRDGVFYAYTTLNDMADSDYKDTFVQSFDALELDCDLDKVYVTYTYDFSDGFFFEIKVEHKDIKQDEYVDNSLYINLSVFDVNEVSVEIYSEEDSKFALATDIEHAMEFKPGMVTVNSTTETFEYVISQDKYEDNQRIDNYLPVLVTEGGIYTFTSLNGGQPVTTTIYNAEGGIHNERYFSPGVYFIQNVYVPYGKTTLTMEVDCVVLDDYGDITNPTPIDGNGFTANLERVGDMQAFSFTPTESGIYEFSPTESGFDVAILVYDGDLVDQGYAIYTASNYLTCSLNAGETYVFEVKYQYGETEDAVYEGVLTFVGNPSREPQALTTEMQEYFVGNGEFKFYFDVEIPGYYALEFEHIAGVEPSGYSVDDSEGEYYNNTVTIDNAKYYVLEKGRYYFNLYGGGTRQYFKGNVRILLFREGVQEERFITLSDDEYTTLTVNLPTNNSYVEYVFTVSEECSLFRYGYNCTLYKENGTTVVGGRYTVDTAFDVTNVVESTLTPGTYILRVANYSSGDEIEATVSLRLQYQTE